MFYYFKIFLDSLTHVILWNLCCIRVVVWAPFLVSNVGYGLWEAPLAHPLLLSALCILFLPPQPTQSYTIVLRALTPQPQKNCTCKSILCSDLWITLLMHKMSFWIFMDSRRNLASWNPFINSLQLGWVVLGNILQLACCICANISHHVLPWSQVPHWHF